MAGRRRCGAAANGGGGERVAEARDMGLAVGLREGSTGIWVWRSVWSIHNGLGKTTSLWESKVFADASNGPLQTEITCVRRTMVTGSSSNRQSDHDARP